MSVSPQSSLLFVPHCAPGGGAGTYISDLIRHLSKDFLVESYGKYGVAYLSQKITGSRFEELILPYYEGVSLRAKLYWLVRLALVHRNQASAARNDFRSLANKTAIVLTSSIQLPLALVLRKIGYNGKIVCLMQEHVSDFYIRLLKPLLRQIDLYVCVAKSTAVRIQGVGLASLYLPNRFDFETSTPILRESYDAVYLGGGLRLKGFDFLTDALKSYRSQGLAIAMLGKYRDRHIKALSSIERRSKGRIRISVIGHVHSVQSYISASKIVVMPIERYHFCRPAVEAGFAKRTYIVPNFSQIEDFAIPGQTSFCYEPGSRASFCEVLDRALADRTEREARANHNHYYVWKNFSSDAWTAKFDTLCEWLGG